MFVCNNITKLQILLLSTYTPDSDKVVSVTSKQSRAIGAPGKGDGRWDDGLLTGRLGEEVGCAMVKIGNDGLALEVPDLDRALGGGAQPIAIGAEDERVDDVTGLGERVQVLALVEVPQHGNSVLATAGAQRTVGRNRHGVDVTGVADEVRSQAAVSEVPDLDELVPSTRNNHWVAGVGREAHAANPLLVRAFAFAVDGVLALTESVPQLERLVARARDDLTVVGREGNAHDIL
jgi:hypothetical protein